MINTARDTNLTGTQRAPDVQISVSSLHVGPNQNSWTPEPSLWTMTWRVHHMTFWDLQVFETSEGFLHTTCQGMQSPN